MSEEVRMSDIIREAFNNGKKSVLKLIERRKKSLEETLNNHNNNHTRSQCIACYEITIRLKELKTITGEAK